MFSTCPWPAQCSAPHAMRAMPWWWLNIHRFDS
jgi:hypothetical protein